MTTGHESDWNELDLPRGAQAPRRRPQPNLDARSSASGAKRGPVVSAARWGVGATGDVQRLRALTGAPQAVVKIIGYRRGGGGGAAASLRYIGREGVEPADTLNGLGELPLETNTGETLISREDRDRLLRQWADGFSNRQDARDVMHLMLSFPTGVSAETAQAIAREALPLMVPGRDFVFGVHTDTAHVHVHALIRMRGPDGRQLRTDRTALQGWREIVAERARTRDVALEASPRWARGRGEKRERDWERAMRQRGEIPRTHRAAAREVLELIANGQAVESRFEALLRATAARERAALQGLSWALIAEARTAPPDARGRLLDLAELALARAAALPDPQSRRAIMAAIVEARVKEAGGEAGPVDADTLARAFAEGRETRATAQERERLSEAPLARVRDETARTREATGPAPSTQRELSAGNAAPNTARDPAQKKDQDRDRDRE